jgi:hypothetical protein
MQPSREQRYSCANFDRMDNSVVEVTHGYSCPRPNRSRSRDPRRQAGDSRLSVEFVIGLLADGWSEAEIFENYPGIGPDDVRACLAYARDMLKDERVFPSTS